MNELIFNLINEKKNTETPEILLLKVYFIYLILCAYDISIFENISNYI
jgi:hypothetical protein